jgi:hypothetical protein
MRLAVLGAAFSVGGAHPGCRLGPQVFYEQEYRGLHRRLPLAHALGRTGARKRLGLAALSSRCPCCSQTVLARLKHRVLPTPSKWLPAHHHRWRP